MKVLQINANYGFGSTGLIVKDIGEMINNNGDDCYFAFQHCNIVPNNSYKFRNIIDEKLHALYARVFGMQAYASKFQTKKFLKWIDKIKPDIVHLHNLHSNFIHLNMLLKYLAKRNIATVITMHDCWYFTGKCFHYVEYGCDKWKDHCGHCPQKHNTVNSIFFDRSRKVINDREKYINAIPNIKIIGCSKWISNECKQSVLKSCNIDYIYNGVDTSIFKPTENKFRKEHKLKNKFLILGFAGKWCIDSNNEAVNNIIASLGENDRIVLVGCSNEVKNKYSSNVKVVCVDFIKDRNVLADVYSSCDVFVNLTHADTLPTVNMESICCGTPVITYDVCGSPELVDKESGFIVKENDIVSLLECINKIKNNNLNTNIEKARTKFDKNQNYLKYLEVYKDLIKK